MKRTFRSTWCRTAVVNACLVLAVTLPCAADNEWPNWRGPHFNGTADGSGYPTSWSATENVAWKVELPGLGGSTPAVWGDHIFVSSGDEKKNAVIALDRRGQILWKTHLGDERPGKHRKGSGANPSPTTDGHHVYAYFKSGDLGCLDMQGKVVWHHNLQKEYGEDTLWWDLGTSPVLTKQYVVVAVIHSGPSYLVAFDKQTGDVAWKVDRNLDAPSESNQTYSTPIPVEIRGKEALIALGADHVTAHDAATGKEIWRVGGLNPRQEQFFRSIASPVVEDGLVIVPYARGATLTAIRLDGQGDITETHVAWTRTGISSDVPTPAASNGRVYVCTDRGEVACLDARTGETLWSGKCERAGGAAYSASPVIADGKLYVTREDGLTSILELGDEFRILTTNKLGDFIVATPVFANGQILIRTSKHLYCIGK